MIGCIIFAGILLLIFLILQIRLKGYVTYGEAGLGADIYIGPVFLGKLLEGSETEKNEKMGKSDRVLQLKKKEKPDGVVEQLIDSLVSAAETVQGLWGRIRIDRLVVRVVWGAEDPASAAVGYGQANAVLGIIWPLLYNNFKVKVKKCDLQADVDYGRTSPEVTVDAVVTLTVGQFIQMQFENADRQVRKQNSSKEKQEVECNE